ncbi:MAG TPA: GNAT family protein [bacterium]|jgi:ribosomal-protein-serine acetyltransferase|nr:GNAT family N-acetyltransferase [bacterium]MDX9806659.1 GNAT family protein [bacterium]HQB10464.1 GNAT family protein [bacterium]
MKTILINKNTVLKQIELSDTADIFETVISQREYLGKWLPFVEFTKEMKDTENFVRSVVDTPEKIREFVFVIHFDGKFAGLVGFKDTDRLNRKTEIGYWLSYGFQKKGIMTESVKLLVKLAFEELNINRIQIKCAVGNTPSSNIPKKLGFKFEGIERAGELFPDGSFKDLEVYGMVKGEYFPGPSTAG